MEELCSWFCYNIVALLYFIELVWASKKSRVQVCCNWDLIWLTWLLWSSF